MSEFHVMPTNDLLEHRSDEDCWCRPIKEDDVWVHSSMDRREEYEQGRKPS
jgi:hypothetical protein